MRQIKNAFTGRHYAVAHVFASTAELFGLIDEGGWHFNSEGSWSAGSREAISDITNPAPRHMMREVEDMLEKLDASVHGRERREYIAGPAGAYAVVPEYLQGLPFNMRRRAHVESDAAPVRLILEASMGGVVTDEQIVRRGAVMAALVHRLSETRPVELYMAWADKVNAVNTVGMVKIETAPLSMNEIVNMLCRPDFGRAVTFAADMLQAGQRGGVSWAWGQEPEREGRNEKVRNILEMDEQDVFIPGGSNIARQEYMTDPIGWMNKWLDPQRGE